jgi:peptidyl-prolyl cis-trans isomerase B (cyclophilin B)
MTSINPHWVRELYSGAHKFGKALQWMAWTYGGLGAIISGRKFLLLSIGTTACLFSASVSLADKLDSDLIPPDITLPSPNAVQSTTSAAAAAASTPAPGLAGAAAQSAGPGAVGSAAGIGAPTTPPSAGVQAFLQQHPELMPYYQKNPSVLEAMQKQMQNPAVPPGQQGAKQMFHLAAPSDPSKPDPIAIIDTSKGVIKIRLFRQLAPITVGNFIDIATKGFYNGLIFHRVETFCIQGGCPKGDGTGDYIDPVTHQPRYVQLEISSQLRHNGPGVVAMARTSDPNSASCQFYITKTPVPHLDNQYSVFGGVIQGLDVVPRIQKGDKINSISVQETQ